MEKKKKKNPQDATLRNINALKKKVSHLAEEIYDLTHLTMMDRAEQAHLEHRIAVLEGMKTKIKNRRKVQNVKIK